ncbi:DNA repair protein [Serendipita vermifera]|nr:DNA repair protein [Serendipita vermifera]
MNSVAKSSQSTNLFGDDQDDFEEALMEIDFEPRSGQNDQTDSKAPGVSATPTTPHKRKHSEVESEPLEDEIDIDHSALANIRRKTDKNDIYGASTFGDWGEYMARKRAKLQIQNKDLLETGSGIFKGIEIYVNGRTNPSVQDLRELIVTHGGIFHAYLVNKSLVTHIIAQNLTPAKVKEYQRMKVVRPEWITESIKAGELLPWTDFKLLMNDRVEVGQGKRIAQTTLPVVTSQVPRTSVAPERKEYEPEVVDGIQDPIYMTDPVTFEQAARIPSYALHKSNQAAQRLMAKPGWKEDHTASSGTKFINSYYEHSRLHHLSMWKAELKDLVAKARERFEEGADSQGGDSENVDIKPPMGHGVSMKGAELVKTWELPTPTKKGKETRTPVMERIYMHCDFDAFFVSVGLLDRPELRGKPVVVCHSQGSGEGAASTSEIASSSYEARDAGIRNGMSLGQARQMCPEVTTLPYEFEKYKEISLKFYTILLSFADEIQAVSVDEALLDVSHAVANLKVVTVAEDPDASNKDFARLLAEMIRARVLEVVKCNVSIGIAENLLLARIASRRAKPAGIYHLHTTDASSFLAPMPLDMIWGVGYSNKKKAEEKLDIKTIGDIQLHTKGALIRVFGPAMGEKLWKAAQGLDDTKLQPDQKRKSVSAEINFGIRFENNEQAEQFMRKLGAEVSARLKAIDMKGRLLTLKVMKRHPEAPVEAPKFMGHGICETFSKSGPISDPKDRGPTSHPEVIGEAAWTLLQSLKFDPTELRGLGLQVTRLEGGASSAVDDKWEAGQQKLEFKAGLDQRVKSPSDADGSLMDTTLNLLAEYRSMDESTIDPEVLESLPADIREEVLGQLRNGAASTSNSVVEGTLPPQSTLTTKVELVGDPSISTPPRTPQKSNAQNFPKTEKQPLPIIPRPNIPDVSHITRQLRPKAKPNISPLKSSIFTRQREALKATREEIVSLGIDPEVFFNLPEDLQREQLIHERNKRRAVTGSASKFGMKVGFGSTSVGKGKNVRFGFGMERSPSVGLPKRSDFKLVARFPEKVPLYLARPTNGAKTPAVRPRQPVPPASKGKEREIIVIDDEGEMTETARPPPKPEKQVQISEIGDIQAHVKRWVVTCYRQSSMPANTDINGLKTWLVKCMELPGTESGIEKVVVVLKWWRELLRRHWGREETEKNHAAIVQGASVISMDDSESKKEEAVVTAKANVGIAWWEAFQECKEAVDVVSRRRFGGKVSLR